LDVFKAYIESMRSILRSSSWKTKTTVCWGMRDRWLSYDGVEEFFGGLNQKIVELPMVCHENPAIFNFNSFS
jgi:hypothetical protein